MTTINIAILEKYFPNINFLNFDISNNFIDLNTLNIIYKDNSDNLLLPPPNENSIFNTLYSKFRDPHQPLKKYPKTSRGIGGKKPGDPGFNIKSHISFLESLRNNNVDLPIYLFNLESSPEINHITYINNLKNMYEYDIYSNNNDISFILNKYYYKN